MAEQVEGTGRTRAGRAAPAGPERWSHKTRDQEKLTWPGAPSTRTGAAAPAGAGTQERLFKAFPCREGLQLEVPARGDGFGAGIAETLCLPRDFQRAPGPGGGEPPGRAQRPRSRARRAVCARAVYTHEFKASPPVSPQIAAFR